MSTEGREHERLEVLVGRWRTEGWTRESGDHPAEAIEATDTYEWLPGGFALLHVVNARVGDRKVEGAEIIGYDPARASYVTLYFGSDGATAYEATLVNEGDVLEWAMHGETTKVRGAFQYGRQHDHGALGVARRRSAMAAVDGHHVD